ncbi:MAG: undecaprenyl/decaprenyl-phosphate alpha-N-acetylglucosaminyl 1-phosphate transferase [Saprospiraceae bacterium]|jgi:UDP-GlcNAc:undecaprenyl-phosphate GlcNAc-1-phosphate transferase|nr:undecaprenyl/decaprenyl-phosphate alpha-N-acetylglucosaminyl 1-phosphate transferase [Saprospiraceae bacterium]MBP9209356.1 undecaprenyl/decaprenyl-phosphate alpha-N-acetylglucosaminyl 1-phosphate transferase [Saprospiraceae bacterium]MBV6474236.1 Undecaprenyl-phosphate alpha-N-acetylglucosaminyl 1-phosphate transferase [Saprospiraceae bacterium]
MFYRLVLSFLTAFIATYLIIPSIISIAKIKRLTDEPDERRAHKRSIPTLGGIGIFAGVLFSIVLWTPFELFGNLQYILCAFIVIFLIGAKDDIIPLTPYKKMIGLILAALILVFQANIRITSFYGIFSIEELPFAWSVAVSLFTILVIVNAFNLIDGINALSGSMGILIASAYGAWFYLADQVVLSIISFALVGSLIAFLKFNLTPAKIFMGDTGSLLIGMICSILTIRFIEHASSSANPAVHAQAAPAVAIGILFLPLFDMLRVFVVRLLSGHSPFSPDRRHIHHLLVDSGLNHLQSTILLVGVNSLVILFVLQAQEWGNVALIAGIIGFGTTLSALLTRIHKQKNALRHDVV